MTLLGLGVMSVAMLLAVRPAWLEHRLHKRLGIAGLVMAFLLWPISPGPKWLVGAAIRADLCANGLPAARFHQELFEMR